MSKLESVSVETKTIRDELYVRVHAPSGVKVRVAWEDGALIRKPVANGRFTFAAQSRRRGDIVDFRVICGSQERDLMSLLPSKSAAVLQ
jgi:hypothetical protein